MKAKVKKLSLYANNSIEVKAKVKKLSLYANNSIEVKAKVKAIIIRKQLNATFAGQAGGCGQVETSFHIISSLHIDIL